jgi:3-ketosteroid 9alpha-monooxygenase subunit A
MEQGWVHPFPAGWYFLVYSEDLREREVRPQRLCGQEFVIWRGAGGRAHAFDAYCPHLGTHLGYGGVVEGDTIRCPFHGWSYDTEGRCVHVPYDPRGHRAARADARPLVERNGMVMMWWHPDGKPPAWDVPLVSEYEDPAWSKRYYRHHWPIDTVWQEIAENAVDVQHFSYLHGIASLPQVESYGGKGEQFWINVLYEFETARGRFPGSMVTRFSGPGMATVHFTIQNLVEIMFVETTTPLDEGRVDLRFSYLTRKGLSGGSVMAASLVRETIRQVDQDVPIWEHKRYWRTPRLSRNDGPIMQFRSWARQFSPASDSTSPSNAWRPGGKPR